MSTYLLDLTDELKKRRQHSFHDEFYHYVDADMWTLVASDSGTAVVGDAAGGVLTLAASDGTEGDNDESYLKSTHEVFLFAADKPMMFEARVKFTEANTDDANILVGVLDAVAANTLVDDGGGPKASYSGACFYKVDGGTVWVCESSIAGAQVTTTTTVTAGGAYQTLRIEYHPLTATTGEVVFYIDGVQEAKHAITVSSATEMNVGFGVKNGGANGETLLIDVADGIQLR